jgi:hypothetical protein
MQNRMLAFMVKKGLSKFKKSIVKTGIEMYTIGDILVWVNSETDIFSQKLILIGKSPSGDLQSFEPMPKREDWHFTELARYTFSRDEHEYIVCFQYIYWENKNYEGSLRCVVDAVDGEGSNEEFNTDFECWEDVENFLA